MCYNNYIKCGRLIYSLRQLFYDESDANIKAVQVYAYACGPIGQKLLQFMVMHDGFLSSTTKDKLKYIFEDCITHSWEETELIYKEDFDRDIYDDFDIKKSCKVPIGSGTIGQVYKLYHRELKQYVALKVRHLDIEVQTATFIKVVNDILAVVHRFVLIPFSIMIKEFLNNIECQLDYCLEAYHTNTIRINCREDTHIIIPEVYYNSCRVIAMSYHEGTSFLDIADKRLKAVISADMFLFNVSSLMVHDLLHCDLHYGNWKVLLNDEDEGAYKLIIYDCGITGSTHNDAINKKIFMASMDGDYQQVYEIIAPDMHQQKHGLLMKQYTKEIMDKYYVNTADRFTDFLKQLSVYQININTAYLRCIQGLLTCLCLLLITAGKLTKILGKDGSRLEVYVCYYGGVLEKINKYPALSQYINAWIASDPTIETVFYNWLDENFGHRDKSVFIDAMLEKLFN